MSHEFLNLLYAAVNSPRGVEIRAWPSAESLRTQLYKLRGEDPLFAQLAFQLSPAEPSQYLWITKARPDEPNDQ